MSKKILQGVIVACSGNKTVSVLVERRVMHKKYRKIVKRNKKYLAHDEENRFNVGDRIMIVESRPISKLKKWQVLIEK